MDKKPVLQLEGFKYQINQHNHTANVIGTIFQSEDILIQRSVRLQDQDYIILSIGTGAFSKNSTIKTVRFAENSELRTIEKESFSSSSLEKIIIPSHVQQIGDRAFQNCKKLQTVEFSENSELEVIGNFAFCSTSIKRFTIPSKVRTIKDGCFRFCQLSSIWISPNNKHFQNRNSYLLYRENESSPIYDVLLYSKSDIEEAVIPSFITTIGANAFDGCKKLRSVDFPANSELKWIENYAFTKTSIETIKIPTKVQRIGEYAFASCGRLKLVEFEGPSELKLIDRYAFSSSPIVKLSVPKSVKQIGESCFSSCDFLKTVLFESGSQLRSIDKSAFSSSSIIKISIPSNVTQIGERCFSLCKDLQCVEFQSDSQLRMIDNYTFYSSSIVNVFVPPSVKKIGEFAFAACKYLNQVKFDENSQLLSIEKDAFSSSSLVKIEIPSRVVQIGEHSFSNCKKLETVEISENSDLRSIGNQAFSATTIKKLTISSNVDLLAEECFKNTPKLTNLVVSQENKYFQYIDDSFLVSKENENSDDFDYLLFVRRDIETAVIPTTVKEIGLFAFDSCKNLKAVQFQFGTQITYIHRDVFQKIQLKMIVVPSILSNLNVFLNDTSELYQFGLIDEKVKVDRLTFNGFQKLSCVSLPYATSADIEKGCNNFRILIPKNCKLNADEDAQKEHKIRRVFNQLLEEKIFPSKEDEINFLHEKVDFLSGPNTPVKK